MQPIIYSFNQGNFQILNEWCENFSKFNMGATSTINEFLLESCPFSSLINEEQSLFNSFCLGYLIHDVYKNQDLEDTDIPFALINNDRLRSILNPSHRIECSFSCNYDSVIEALKWICLNFELNYVDYLDKIGYFPNIFLNQNNNYELYESYLEKSLYKFIVSMSVNFVMKQSEILLQTKPEVSLYVYPHTIFTSCFNLSSYDCEFNYLPIFLLLEKMGWNLKDNCIEPVTFNNKGKVRQLVHALDYAMQQHQISLINQLLDTSSYSCEKNYSQVDDYVKNLSHEKIRYGEEKHFELLRIKLQHYFLTKKVNSCGNLNNSEIKNKI